MISDEQIERVISAIEHGHTNTFSTTDYVAMAAVAISLVSIIVAIGIFKAQQTAERRRYTAQMHDWYWSPEFKEVREEVYSLRSRWLASDNKKQFIVEIIDGSSPESVTNEWRNFGRLVFFFSDIERNIRKKIIDHDLALEMFGVAQYEWFSDLIREIRSVIEERHENSKNPPSWISRTKALEKMINDLAN